MKFSDITEEEWDELSPYLDTCLLPVTGMTGSERPFEATECLEKLRDMMDLVEIPFKGRVVTYPAFHYALDEPLLSSTVEDWCEALKKTGFRYVILVTANRLLQLTCKQADLTLRPEEDGSLPNADQVSRAVLDLWNG